MRFHPITDPLRIRHELSVMRSRARMVEMIYAPPRKLRTDIADESRDALAMVKAVGLPLPPPPHRT